MSYPAGTLNLEAVKLGIWQWIVGITQGIVPDNQIIWRNQSEALPPRPCVTMKIIGGPSPTDRDASLLFNPNPGQMPPTANQSSVFTAGMQMEMQLSIQVFGNTRVHRPLALQLTLDLNTSLIRQSILDKLKASGVSIQGKSAVQNLTALEETEFEERAGFEVSMGLVQNVFDSPGIIKTVNTELETPEGDRSNTIELP
jgi:hypothetical protein